VARLDITDWIETAAGRLPRVSTELTPADRWGGIRARIGVGRMNYSIEPGLYAVGKPGPESYVFVTANYKLSFDSLRCELAGLDGWVMVLDTRGINVWCAAGKGTFGTDEVVRRLERTRLKDIVRHRKLILPQLGATGVAGHEVRMRSGFSVIFGPVRAADIKSFLDAGMKATPEMRQVTFGFADRLRVAPVDALGGRNYLIVAVILLLAVSGFRGASYSAGAIRSTGVPAAASAVLAYLAGTIIFPLLLPWLPGRAFSLKGFFLGLVLFILSLPVGLAGDGFPDRLAWLLMFGAGVSFIAMNFTGSSTYTSLSGVRKEMRTAVPLQLAGAAVGIGLWIAGRFI
jgi:hypothetical protein